MNIDITQYNVEEKPTWCAGCGNFAIHTALKKALSELEISPSQTFISFDIGCNGNGADKIQSYRFKGLHGRSIPLAIGAHLANTKYTTIADIGDGGCLHEGLDHLIHAIRSNYNITILIHNNQNFALTTGQATATTQQGKEMYALPDGKPERDLSISKLVKASDGTFFARGYSGDPLQLSEIIKKGIQHNGCSVIEIMQICPTYNPESTPQWFLEHIKKVEEPNPELAYKEDFIYTGVLFTKENIPSFMEKLENRKDIKTELVDEVKQYPIDNLIQKLK